MINTLIGTVLVSLLSVQKMEAQDLHYSLPFRTPLLLNPGFTGAAQGHYRASLAYKNQWSAIETPFKTTYAAYDMKLIGDDESDNYLGVGMALFNDKAGKTKMGLNQSNLSGAYGLRLNILHFFSGGLSLGFSQHSAQYEGLKWDSQHDGVTYDAALPTGESALPENYFYMDVGAGVTWTYTPLNYYSFNFGFAVSHANKAKDTYFADGTDRENLKLVLHGSSDWELNKHWSVLPELQMIKKGGAYEITGGSFVRYITGENSKYTTLKTSSSASVGLFYRYGDAAIFALLYDYKRVMSLAISYDLNLSPLKVASSSRGGIEISLLYKGFFEQQRIKL